ncbi:MAG: Holliday junction resolvase RuvX [Cyanobacteria bacterium P01_H01_bin.58]
MTKYVSALGLDVGHKRIGVAGCDRLGLLATGLTTVKRTSFQAVVQELQELVDSRQVDILVVGLPYTMEGAMGTQAHRVQSFARRLSAALNLPVEYVDERLTSYQAEQELKAEGQVLSRRNRNKGLIDRRAAVIILQQWLDQQARCRSTPLVDSIEPPPGDSE